MRVPVQKFDAMSLEEKDTNTSPPLYFQLDSFPKKNALIASLQPPKEPTNSIHHVPCDIVLVIDVSGSMYDAAPVPGDNSSEANGLSILDLVKHAALTIIETMDERDRLSIVTFASSVSVLQPLECMTEENKEKSRANIKSMVPKDATNLWQGILTGLKQFEDVKSDGKVPAVMVLTDGMPNHMCPPAGYIPKLRTKLPLPASIHTFGFGYHLRSGLLKSIAEIGNGNYSFIPDAGMIGAVFVHAVANLQNTYAVDATLQLKYTEQTQIREAMGTTVLTQPPEPLAGTTPAGMELTIPLGNIQYGQSRNVFLRIHSPYINGFARMAKGPLPIVEATLTYKPVLDNEAGKYSSASMTHNLLDTSSTMPESQLAYHESRAQICAFLSSLFPIERQGEHETFQLSGLPEVNKQLAALIDKIPARLYSDPLNASLMKDLAGAEPEGQITIALAQEAFVRKWGQHYLPSLLNAHTRQVCNSFKDPGPLQYGADSPLFTACRDRLDEVFDNLPPPTPSRHQYRGRASSFTGGGSGAGVSSYAPVSMGSYRNARGVCFAGSTPVQLTSGRAIEIKRLRRGMKVQTPLGSRKVAAVLRTPVKDVTLCRVGGVLVTPWHPVSLDGKAWTFPAYGADKAVRYTGSIYSIMLQRDRNPDAHAIRLEGGGGSSLWGVTLGHGILSGGDTRAHTFFGDYNAVGKSLLRLSVGLRGEFIGSGVERSGENGLVCGFRTDASRGRVLAWSPGPRGKTSLRI